MPVQFEVMWSQRVVQQTPAPLNPPLFFQATDHMHSNFTTVTWAIPTLPPLLRQSRTADAAFIRLSCLSMRTRVVRLSLCALLGDVNASGRWCRQRSRRPVPRTLFFSQIVSGFQPPTTKVGCKQTGCSFFVSLVRKKAFGPSCPCGSNLEKKNGLQVVGVAKV